MCGRLTQYRGIHDFVAALSMPNALADSAGDQARYNIAPSTQVALLHVDNEVLRADRVRWGWRPHWAKDRAPPINARAENPVLKAKAASFPAADLFTLASIPAPALFSSTAGVLTEMRL